MKKNLIVAGILAILMALSGCSEDNKKKIVKEKILTEYEKGYKYGLELYKTDNMLKGIAKEVIDVKKMKNGTIKSSMFALLSGKISVACSAPFYKDDTYKNRIDFVSGGKKGCFDRFNMLSK